MKPWSTIRPGVKLNTRFLPVVALLALVTLQSGCKSSPVASSPASISRSRDTFRQPGIPPGNSHASLVCPPVDSSTPPSVPQSKDGHRVILSWTASAPADSKHAAAVGYCVYRGTERNPPPTERVNVSPFPGTKCMDDLVENGKKYYYVVRAINAIGVTSTVSKASPASIPSSPRRNPGVSGDAVPLCREPAGVK